MAKIGLNNFPSNIKFKITGNSTNNDICYTMDGFMPRKQLYSSLILQDYLDDYYDADELWDNLTDDEKDAAYEEYAQERESWINYGAIEVTKEEFDNGEELDEADLAGARHVRAAAEFDGEFILRKGKKVFIKITK